MSARSRRQFFGTAGAAAAWPLLSRMPGAESAALAVGRGGPLKLGVASYSMREFTLDQALEMAKKLGVTRMTFKDVHIPRTGTPEATRALRAKIEAAGITIMGGGTITIPNDPVKIKKEFAYAKDAGFPLIFVARNRPRSTPSSRWRKPTTSRLPSTTTGPRTSAGLVPRMRMPR